MIIQTLGSMCFDRTENMKNVTLALDWITAIALLVVGIVGVTQAAAISPAVGYSFLGAGVVYTMVMLLHSSLQVKLQCSNKSGDTGIKLGDRFKAVINTD